MNVLWKNLFDPANAFYLPNLIQNGDPSLGQPSLDPFKPGGTSAPLALNGMPTGVANSACVNSKYRPNPIAAATPTVQLENVQATGLRAVSAGGPLVYSTTDPIVTAVFQIGTLDGVSVPLVITQNDTTKANFNFYLQCCVPTSEGSTQCSTTQFPATSPGAFNATIQAGTITAVLGLTFPPSGPPTVTVLNVAVAVAVSDISIQLVSVDDPNVQPWARGLAQTAIDKGVASGAFVDGVNSYLKSAAVTAQVASVLNQLLAKLYPSS